MSQIRSGPSTGGAGNSATPGTGKQRGTAPRHPVERRKRWFQKQRFQDQSSGSLQRGVRIFSPGVFQAGQKRRRIEIEAVDPRTGPAGLKDGPVQHRFQIRLHRFGPPYHEVGEESQIPGAGKFLRRRRDVRGGPVEVRLRQPVQVFRGWQPLFLFRRMPGMNDAPASTSAASNPAKTMPNPKSFWVTEVMGPPVRGWGYEW